MLKKCFFSLVFGLSFIFGAVFIQAQEFSTSESENLIVYLKKNDVAATIDFVRNKKLAHPSAIKLQQAEKLLEDAKRRSESGIQRIVLRGDVARIFEFHSLAFEFYQDALAKLESHFQKYGNRNSDFYQIAYKAATCAIWLKDYAQAFSLLKFIETNGDTWVKELGQKRGILLKEFLANPETASQRIRFAKEFWLGFPHIGFYAADTVKFLGESLKLNPTKEETKQIYILIKNTAQDSDDIETAESYLKKMIAEFPKEDFVTEAVFSTARFYFSKGKFSDSLSWLNWIIENSRTNGRFIPLAYLGLSEVYEKLGDEAVMIKFLKLAAQNPNVVATNRNIMDTSDTRQVALIRLGKYYKAKRNYEEALKYFTEWQPRSGCGNCQAQSKYEKDLYIAECLIGLKREDEALNNNLMPHLKIDGGELYADAKIPQLVVSIYEKRNALEDFLALIKPNAASKYNYAAQIAEKLAQIKVSAKNEEIEKLVSELKHRGGYVPNITQDFIRESNWQAVAIAEELSKMNSKEFPFLKKRYETLAASKEESAFGDRVWIIYALGVSKAKESEDFLRELLQLTQKENGSAILDDIVFALSLKK